MFVSLRWALQVVDVSCGVLCCVAACDMCAVLWCTLVLCVIAYYGVLVCSVCRYSVVCCVG